MLHQLGHLKRSYADLREAASEMDMLETSTAVSTAVGTSVAVSNASATLLRGLLWQQRDKLFSRWKERFFVLTADYLQCFRRGTSRITEMGAFIFKIRLSEVRNLNSAHVQYRYELYSKLQINTKLGYSKIPIMSAFCHNLTSPNYDIF